VDQDSLGAEVNGLGKMPIWKSGRNNWRDGSRAVILLNRGVWKPRSQQNWEDSASQPGDASVRDLWQHKDLGSSRGVFRARDFATAS